MTARVRAGGGKTRLLVMHRLSGSELPAQGTARVYGCQLASNLVLIAPVVGMCERGDACLDVLAYFG